MGQRQRGTATERERDEEGERRRGKETERVVVVERGTERDI